MTSTIKVDNIQTAAGATPKAKDVGINDAGTILQVKSTLYTTREAAAYTAATATAVDALAVTITPRDANSKFLIMVRASGEINGNNEHDTVYGVMRNGTPINESTYGSTNGRGLAMIQIAYHADDNDSTPSTTTYQTVDSPATTSQITYKASIWQLQGYGKVWNGCVNGGTTTTYEVPTSEIIVMEIAG